MHVATWPEAVPVSNCRATNSPHTWWLRALIYLPSWASECELGPAGLLLVVNRVVVVRRWLGQQPEKACLRGGPRGPSPSHGGQWTLLWQAPFTMASLGHTGFSPAWGRRPKRECLKTMSTPRDHGRSRPASHNPALGVSASTTCYWLHWASLDPVWESNMQ